MLSRCGSACRAEIFCSFETILAGHKPNNNNNDNNNLVYNAHSVREIWRRVNSEKGNYLLCRLRALWSAWRRCCSCSPTTFARNLRTSRPADPESQCTLAETDNPSNINIHRRVVTNGVEDAGSRGQLTPNVRVMGQGYIPDHNNLRQEHIFLHKTNQNAGFWSNFQTFPGILPWTLATERSYPSRTLPRPSLCFLTSNIFDAPPSVVVTQLRSCLVQVKDKTESESC